MGLSHSLVAWRVAAVIVVAGAAFPAVAAPGPFDGVYRAEAIGFGGQCHNFPATLRVSEGNATLKLDAITTFEGMVSGSGSIDVTVQSASLRGQIADKVFHGHMSGVRCQYELVLPKQ